MTALRRWRKVARSLIIVSFTWEAAAALGSLVLLILVAVQGGGEPTTDRLVSLVGTLGLLGVVIGAIWDARRRTRRRLAERAATWEEEG